MRCPPALPFDVIATGLVVSGRAALKGATFRESSGTATARVDVLDGSASGRLLDTFTLQANESATDWFDAWGIGVEQGVFCNVASGAVVGAVLVIPETRLLDFSLADLYTAGNQ